MVRARMDDAPFSGRSLHFVGVGGAGMSGIARIMLARGISVSGCDMRDSRGLVALRARGGSTSQRSRPSATRRPAMCSTRAAGVITTSCAGA